MFFCIKDSKRRKKVKKLNTYGYKNVFFFCHIFIHLFFEFFYRHYRHPLLFVMPTEGGEE